MGYEALKLQDFLGINDAFIYYLYRRQKRRQNTENC